MKISEIWKWRRVVAVMLVVFWAAAQLAPPTASAQGARCFSETGFCIDGRIREFWEQNGGLPVFGLPKSDLAPESIEGKTVMVQWFERNRLELHPENPRPYDVLLGRLGVDRLVQQGRDWQQFGRPDPNGGGFTNYFPESGHAISSVLFYRYWSSHGLELDGRPGKTQAESLALFGLPISEPQHETLSDGQEYLVQWFERARFEEHDGNVVLLGLLGNEVHIASPPSNIR